MAQAQDSEDRDLDNSADLALNNKDDQEWVDNVYPYCLDEFGALVLSAGITSAKLVSLNNYGGTLRMGIMSYSNH